MTMEQDEEFEVVSLEKLDGTQVDFAVLAVFPYAEHSYIALIGLDEDGNIDEKAPVFLRRYNETGDDMCEIDDIEDEEEYNAAAQEYNRLCEEENHD